MVKDGEDMTKKAQSMRDEAQEIANKGQEMTEKGPARQVPDQQQLTGPKAMIRQNLEEWI